MRILIAVLLACLLPSPAFAQSGGGGFTNMLRSLSGMLGAGRDPAPPTSTAPIGIRGMDEGGTQTTGPATEDVKLLEGWAVSRTEAEQTAKRRGLVARAATYEEASTETAKSGEAQ